MNKIKALLQIFLVVSLIFFTSGLVAAEETPNVCCQETNSGEFCQYTEQSNCLGNEFFPGECSEYAPCSKLVCCDLSGEGQGCMLNTVESACIAQGGKVLPDPLCNYEQCVPGCCEIGSGCKFINKNQCDGFSEDFPNLGVEFNTVSSEQECANRCLTKEKGCCVDDCSYSTVEECSGDFFPGEYCSGVLACEECKSQDTKACVEDSKDVWYFDSCGNKEGIAKTCDYALGEICRDGECKDMNCEDVWDNPYVDENKDGIFNNDDARFTNGYDYRLNGESWCEFQGNAGPTLDMPGTRHYVHYCENGEEKVFECDDYREEFCVERQSGDGKNVAECVDNDWYSCADAMTEGECNGGEYGTCYWIASGEFPDEEDPEYIEYKKNVERNEDGFCVPLISPGENKDNQDTLEVCNNVDSGSEKIGDLKAVWAGVSQYNCKSGCSIYTPQTLNSFNTICSAQGDCGADYNVIGEWANGGFYRDSSYPKKLTHKINNDKNCGDVPTSTWKKVRLFLSPKYHHDDKNNKACLMLELAKDFSFVPNPENFEEFRQKDLGILNLGVLDIKDFSSGDFWNKALLGGDGDAGFQALSAFNWILGVGGSAVAVSLTTAAFVGGSIGLAGAGIGTGVTSTIWTVAGTAAGTLTSTGIGVVIALAVVIVAAIITGITLGLYDTMTHEVEVDCQPWEAPDGDEYCHLCHEPGDGPIGFVDLTAEGQHECGEYLCNSLGKACTFVETEEGPRCMGGVCELNPTQSVIKFDSIEAECTGGCNVEYGQYGVIINNKIKAEQGVKFIVKTWEDLSGEIPSYANCRWAETDGFEYDEGQPFDQLSNSDVHNLTFTPSYLNELVTDGERSIYIKCKNNCGNVNDVSYAIQFDVIEMEGFTAPMIKEINTTHGSHYIAHDVNDTEVIVTLYKDDVIPDSESNTFAGCKWSKLDEAYDVMENKGVCSFGDKNTWPSCDLHVTNLTMGGNEIYIRCKNIYGAENQQSRKYTLTKVEELVIDSVKCVTGFGDECKAELPVDKFDVQVVTSGGANNGVANCVGGISAPQWEFQETDANKHKQPMGPLFSDVDYTYGVWCTDVAGNQDSEQFEFSIKKDKIQPIISKAYYSNGGLYVETDEKATCKYTLKTPFVFENATIFSSTGDLEHFVSVGDNSYFVIGCRDLFDNTIDDVTLFLTMK